MTRTQISELKDQVQDEIQQIITHPDFANCTGSIFVVETERLGYAIREKKAEADISNRAVMRRIATAAGEWAEDIEGMQRNQGRRRRHVAQYGEPYFRAYQLTDDHTEAELILDNPTLDEARAFGRTVWA